MLDTFWHINVGSVAAVFTIIVTLFKLHKDNKTTLKAQNTELDEIKFKVNLMYNYFQKHFFD